MLPKALLQEKHTGRWQLEAHSRNLPCNAFALHGALRDDPVGAGKVSF